VNIVTVFQELWLILWGTGGGGGLVISSLNFVSSAH